MEYEPGLVSVIIPTYNRADKLRYALTCLVNQTYRRFEVIVCDDGSTDDSKEVTETFADQLKITYLRETNFGGPARPRNNGIRQAKGEFIAFLDSDDWWYPEKLGLSLKYLAGGDIFYHDLDRYLTREKQSGVVKGRALSGDIFKDIVINGNGIPNSSVVIRRKIVDQVGEVSEDKNLIAVEDTDYWTRVAKVTNRFVYAPLSLGGYWIGENISVSVKQLDRETYLLEKYIVELSPDEAAMARGFLAFRKARIYHKLSMFKEAVECYKSALGVGSKPVVFKSFAGIIACKFQKVI
jgi:glycosyltransferase involved in cell wall biosynthesis